MRVDLELLRASATDIDTVQQGRPAKLGRYVVGELLGQGGMGAVYAAFDPHLQRRVAIKVLAGEPSTGASARLHREAEALATLSHPNVVTIYEVGWCPFGLFVVMELVEGMPLSTWLEHHPDPRARFDAALELLIQVGRGLAAAHGVGLVHRDVKPSNVLVGRDHDGSPRARVADFGLARLHQGGSSSGSSSGEVTPTAATHDRVGTPGYMSPEQIDGEPSDARSDQFSFCVTAFEALFGGSPFVGDTLYKRRVSIERGPVRPQARGAAQRKIADALRIGLAESPDARHQETNALLALLEGARARPQRALVFGLVVATAVLGLVLAGEPGRQHAAIDPCAQPQPMTRWWDDEGAAALTGAAERFELSPAMHDSLAASSTRQALRHDDAWQRACKADSDDERDLRMACLAEHREETEQVFAALVGDARALREQGAEAIEGIADPARCNDLARARGSDVHDALRRELTGLLVAARTAARGGRFDHACALAVAVHARAWAAGRVSLQARAGYELGGFLFEIGRPPVAREWLTRAREDATRAGDDITVVEAALAAARIEERGSERALLFRHAETAMARVGGDSELEAAYWSAKGNTANVSGDAAAAVEAHQRALAIKRTDDGSNRLAPVENLLGISQAMFAQHHRTEAIEWAREALAIAQDVLGPRHPTTLVTRASLVRIGAADDPRAAVSQLEELEQELRAVVGERNARLASLQLGIATAEAALGELDRSEARMLRVVELMRELAGDENNIVAGAHYQLGYVALRRRDLDGAWRHFSSSLELFDSMDPGSHAALQPEIALANIASQREQWPDAIARLRRALSRLDGEPTDGRRADVLVKLASALFDSGETEPARAYVDEALPVMAASFGPDSQRMAELLHLRGDLEQRDGELAAAIVTYAEAERIMLARANRLWRVIGYGRYRQAELHAEAGRMAEARAFAQAAITAYEQDGHAQRQIGELQAWIDRHAPRHHRSGVAD